MCNCIWLISRILQTTRFRILAKRISYNYAHDNLTFSLTLYPKAYQVLSQYAVELRYIIVYPAKNKMLNEVCTAAVLTPTPAPYSIMVPTISFLVQVPRHVIEIRVSNISLLTKGCPMYRSENPNAGSVTVKLTDKILMAYIKRS